MFRTLLKLPAIPLMELLMKLLAIRLTNQKTIDKSLVIAIRLSEQNTLAKSLVISAIKHALSGWLCCIAMQSDSRKRPPNDTGRGSGYEIKPREITDGLVPR
jgi:hypothetical protein